MWPIRSVLPLGPTARRLRQGHHGGQFNVGGWRGSDRIEQSWFHEVPPMISELGAHSMTDHLDQPIDNGEPTHLLHAE